MNVEKELRKILIDENKTIGYLAEKLGVSNQNLSAKFRRNNFRIKEVEDMLNLLGYDLELKIKKRNNDV